jgi:hypothetical protein
MRIFTSAMFSSKNLSGIRNQHDKTLTLLLMDQ